jgi:poly(3-hydroxybutyrate) depolymerase
MMRRALLNLLAAVCCWELPVAAQEAWTAEQVRAAHQHAETLHRQQKYREAAAEYQKILAVTPHDYRALYNAACAFALCNDPATAVDLLKRAVEAGWTDVSHLESDSDLNSIRDNPGYRQIVATLRERAAKEAAARATRASKIAQLDREYQRLLANSVIPAVFQEPKGGWDPNPKRGFLPRVKVTAYDHPNGWFHLCVPEGYTPEKAWPLLLVLHGGPNGSPDGQSFAYRGRNAPNSVIVACIQALSPQLELNWNLPHEAMNFLCIIRQIARTYRLDPYRISLTGISMGGGGCYAQGATLCDVWASVVPMCGWYWQATNPPPKQEWRYWAKDVPFYIMHGELDRNVPVELGRMAAKDLQQMGNTKFVYKEFKGIGHDVFNGVDQKDLDDMSFWVYSQRRSTPPDFNAAFKKLQERGAMYGWVCDGSALGTYKSGRPFGAYKTNEGWIVPK